MGMRLSYAYEKLPFTEQRAIARMGTNIMGLKPMRGGALEGCPGITRVLSGHSSAYIVRTGEHEVALIDAGMEVDAGNIRATLEQMELGVSAVKAIFMTHGHVDHAAGAHVFDEATVYAHAHEHAYLQGRVAGEGLPGKLAGKLSAEQRIPASRLQAVEDGQEIVQGDMTFRVYGVAGHTGGSLAYQVGDVLFVGDAMYFDTHGKAKLPPPMITPHRSLAKKSLTTLVNELDGVGIETVLPSHSGEGLFTDMQKGM